MTVSLFKGIHGTARYHAESILEQGFTLSTTGKSGKAGKGIYFWQYMEDKTTAVHCAECWSKFALNKGFYDENKDCSLVKIEVNIESDNSNVLDCNEFFRERFYEAFPIGSFDERTYGAKLDVFIEELEKNLGIKFKLVRIQLSVPSLGGSAAFSNSFPAIIVKDEVKIEVIDCFE